MLEGRALFDCALHFRFLQKATEAMFEMGQASVAASLACQKRIYDDINPPPPPPPPKPLTQADLMQSWFEMANACTAAYWSGVQTPAASQQRQVPVNPIFSPAVMPAFWNVSPWTFYQGPMVAMLLSYGVPYAVAAPTARASTSAMDAADAAYAQWRAIFSSSEGRESLNRNIASSAPWSAYLH